MKYVRFINKFIFITLLAAILSFVASSISEIIILMIAYQRFDLHTIDATPYQPYLYSAFLVYLIIFDTFLLRKLNLFTKN